MPLTRAMGKEEIEEIMEENKKEAPVTEETVTAEESVAEEVGAKESDATMTALAEALAEVDKLKRELAESRDTYLRMLAEYDNYRKRTQKERESTYAEAVAETLAGILPVLDILEKASQYSEAEKIAEGLALTVKQASALLSKLGIEETARVGDTFDPNLHNAVFHVDDEAYGENEIVEIFQRGYRRGDRVVRYAMVKVAN